jgi:hypothetical protein
VVPEYNHSYNAATKNASTSSVDASAMKMLDDLFHWAAERGSPGRAATE